MPKTFNGVSVRLAKADDRAFILSLAERFGATRAAWREHAEVVGGTRAQLARAVDEPRVEDALFVAIDASGERLGFAFVVTHHDFFTGEPHGHISEIATVCDGSGAGRALMDASEAWSLGRRYRYISLNVNDVNIAARGFYDRRAYVPEYRHLVKLL